MCWVFYGSALRMGSTLVRHVSPFGVVVVSFSGLEGEEVLGCLVRLDVGVYGLFDWGVQHILWHGGPI